MALIEAGGGVAPYKTTLPKQVEKKRRKKEKPEQPAPAPVINRTLPDHARAIVKSYYKATGMFPSPDKVAAIAQRTVEDQTFVTDDDFDTLFVDWVQHDEDDIEPADEFARIVNQHIDEIRNEVRRRVSKSWELRSAPKLTAQEKPEEKGTPVEEMREEAWPAKRFDRRGRQVAGYTDEQERALSRSLALGGARFLYETPRQGPIDKRYFDTVFKPNEVIPSIDKVKRLQMRFEGKRFRDLNPKQQAIVLGLTVTLRDAYGAEFLYSVTDTGMSKDIVWNKRFSQYLNRYVIEACLPFAVVPMNGFGMENNEAKEIKAAAMNTISELTGGKIKPDDDIYEVMRSLGYRTPEGALSYSDAAQRAFFSMYYRTRPREWGAAATAYTYSLIFGDMLVPPEFRKAYEPIKKATEPHIEAAFNALQSIQSKAVERVKEQPEIVPTGMVEEAKEHPVYEGVDIRERAYGTDASLALAALATAFAEGEGFKELDWYKVAAMHGAMPARTGAAVPQKAPTEEEKRNRPSYLSRGVVSTPRLREMSLDAFKASVGMGIIAPVVHIEEKDPLAVIDRFYNTALLTIHAMVRMSTPMPGDKYERLIGDAQSGRGGYSDVGTQMAEEIKERGGLEKGFFDFADIGRTVMASWEVAGKTDRAAARWFINDVFRADPEQHGTILSIIDFGEQLALDIAATAGAGALVRGGAKLGALGARKLAQSTGREIGGLLLSRASRAALDTIEVESSALSAQIRYFGRRGMRREVKALRKRLAALELERRSIISRPLWYDTLAERLARGTQDPAILRMMFGVNEKHLGLVRKGGKLVVDDALKANEARNVEAILRRVAESRNPAEITRLLSNLNRYGIYVSSSDVIGAVMRHRVPNLTPGATIGDWMTHSFQRGQRYVGDIDDPMQKVVTYMRLSNLGLGKTLTRAEREYVRDRINWYAREFSRILPGTWKRTADYRRNLVIKLEDEIEENMAKRAPSKWQIRQLKILNHMAGAGLRISNVKNMRDYMNALDAIMAYGRMSRGMRRLAEGEVERFRIRRKLLYKPVIDSETGKVIEDSTVFIRDTSGRLRHAAESLRRRAQELRSGALKDAEEGAAAKKRVVEALQGAKPASLDDVVKATKAKPGLPGSIRSRISRLEAKADELERVADLIHSISGRRPVPFFYGQGTSDLVFRFDPLRLSAIVRGGGPFDTGIWVTAREVKPYGLPSMHDIVRVFKALAIFRYGFAFTAAMVDEFWRLLPEGVFYDFIGEPIYSAVRRAAGKATGSELMKPVAKTLTVRKAWKSLKETEAIERAVGGTIADALRQSNSWSVVSPDDPDYYLWLSEGIRDSRGDVVANIIRDNPRKAGETLEQYKSRIKDVIDETLLDMSDDGEMLRDFLSTTHRIPDKYISKAGRERFATVNEKRVNEAISRLNAAKSDAEREIGWYRSWEGVAPRLFASIRRKPRQEEILRAIRELSESDPDSFVDAKRRFGIDKHRLALADPDSTVDDIAIAINADRELRVRFMTSLVNWAKKEGGDVPARARRYTRAVTRLFNAERRLEEYQIRYALLKQELEPKLRVYNPKTGRYVRARITDEETRRKRDELNRLARKLVRAKESAEKYRQIANANNPIRAVRGWARSKPIEDLQTAVIQAHNRFVSDADIERFISEKIERFRAIGRRHIDEVYERISRVDPRLAEALRNRIAVNRFSGDERGIVSTILSDPAKRSTTLKDVRAAIRARERDIRDIEREIRKMERQRTIELGYDPDDIEEYQEWLRKQVDHYAMYTENEDLMKAFTEGRSISKKEWEAIRDDLRRRGIDLPLIAGTNRPAKPSSWLHPYGVLENTSNIMRKLVFASKFKRYYNNLIAHGVDHNIAFGRAVAYAEKEVDRTMYTHSMTYFDFLMDDILMFAPAYRQAAIYWFKVATRNPLVFKTLYEYRDAYPVARVGDYRVPYPLPFFMQGNIGEMFLPGLSPFFVIPMRSINFMTAWRYDEEEGKFVYDAKNAKLDKLYEYVPPLNFASRTQSPLQFIDDIVWGIKPDWLTPAPQGSALGVIVQSTAMGLWKDPTIRQRIALNIEQTQAMRGLKPDFKKTVDEMKEEPWWYEFLQRFGVQRPEAIFGAVTRFLMPSRMIYDPESFSYSYGPDDPIWDRIIGNKPSTIVEAQWEFARAYQRGDYEEQRRLLSDPNFRAIHNFWKMDVEDRAEFLASKEGIKILPFVTGKYFYKDGRPLMGGEFYDMINRGRIYARSFEGYLENLEDAFRELGWTKTRMQLEADYKKNVARARGNIRQAIREIAKGNPNLKDTLWRQVREWLDWGDGREVYVNGKWVPVNGPPAWLEMWAHERGLDPHEWDIVYLKGVLEGTIQTFQEKHDVSEWGIIDRWVNASLWDTFQSGTKYEGKVPPDRSLEQAWRVGKTLARVLPQYEQIFDPGRSAALPFLKEGLRKLRESKRYYERTFATAPLWSDEIVGHVKDAVTFLGIDGVDANKVTRSLLTIQAAYGKYKGVADAEARAGRPNSSKVMDAYREYRAVREKELAREHMKVFRDGIPYRTWVGIAKEGYGVQKSYFSQVVKAMNRKGEPIYDNIVTNAEAFIKPPHGAVKPSWTERALARAAWGSIALAALSYRRKNMSMVNEGYGMGFSPQSKRMQPYLVRLYGLADAWRKRNKIFAKQFDEYGGYELLANMIDPGY